VVSVATGCMIWGSDPTRYNRFFSSQKLEDQLWSLNAYQDLSLQPNQPGNEAGCSPPCNATVKNKWGYTSPSHICRHCVDSKTTCYLSPPCLFLVSPLLACNINGGKLNNCYWCLTEIGCRTVCRLNGVNLLRKFCTRCPDNKRYDPLLARVCYIVNMCLDRKQLPVQSLLSPATFTLPTPKNIFSYSEKDVAGMTFF
jgi:hypothetical protein